MILSPSEMPVSLYGQALLYGAKSKFLNPPGKVRGIANKTIGKAFRIVARLVYQLACQILGPFGFVYHEGAALKNWIQSLATNNSQQKIRRKELAKEHGKAGLNDVSVLGMIPTYFLNPNSRVECLMSYSEVHFGDEENLLDGDFNYRLGHNYTKQQEIDLCNMKDGNYRYDMLVRYALQAREECGTYPSLDASRVKELCCQAAHAGTYGVGTSLFD